MLNILTLQTQTKKNQHGDVMQSFFLAETMKYAYLIFHEDKIDLGKWVFTTEAHPLKIHSFIPTNSM